ncbi:MAG TPA: DUF2306 domain-containing protein [Chitinophagaceae bacterium]|nr:DUF2306 domain-containing protein [Chitinophagaceae bacterium]
MSELRSILKTTTKDLLVYLVLCAVTYLMIRIILEHVTLGPDVGFLKVKQEYVNNRFWRTAFYIHVFSAIMTLLAGFTQFSTYILNEHRKLHRFMGRIYVTAILYINFPTGMIMAVHANGGLPGKIAFIILDLLWFWFTLKAFLEIRKGNITQHKKYMIRSYALTFSAITLRVWKPVLSSLFIISPETLYIIQAWIGFVPNLFLAEWLIRRQKRNRSVNVRS